MVKGDRKEARIILRMPEALALKLILLASGDNVSTSELVRRACEEYVERRMHAHATPTLRLPLEAWR